MLLCWCTLKVQPSGQISLLLSVRLFILTLPVSSAQEKKTISHSMSLWNIIRKVIKLVDFMPCYIFHVYIFMPRIQSWNTFVLINCANCYICEVRATCIHYSNLCKIDGNDTIIILLKAIIVLALTQQMGFGD